MNAGTAYARKYQKSNNVKGLCKYCPQPRDGECVGCKQGEPLNLVVENTKENVLHTSGIPCTKSVFCSVHHQKELDRAASRRRAAGEPKRITKEEISARDTKIQDFYLSNPTLTYTEVADKLNINIAIVNKALQRSGVSHNELKYKAILEALIANPGVNTYRISRMTGAGNEKVRRVARENNIPLPVDGRKPTSPVTPALEN
jgi:hypothetical protein